MIARHQLLALGYTKIAIEHRIASGRLHAVARGVYAVGRPQITQRGRWMAAVLACGEGAALTHRSAGVLWEIVPLRSRQAPESAAIEVSVPRRLRGRRRTYVSHGLETLEIRVRCRPGLVDAHTSYEAIPVTTPIQTLLDLATVLAPLALERAVNEADKRGLVSPPSLRAALDRYQGRPGVRVLRELLAPETFRLSDSDLEVLFRPIAIRAGLPPPLSKQIVNDLEVDFFWPGLGLVVETDGLRYHRTPSQQARDRLRDQTHVASGLATLRFTHWQVKHDPRYVEDVLRLTASHHDLGPAA